jgi:hypothetical protein
MSNTTIPRYKLKAAETFPKQKSAGFTVRLEYALAKPFLSGKPLRRPARPARLSRAEEDRMDVEASRLGKAEPGTISLDDLAKELGL